MTAPSPGPRRTISLVWVGLLYVGLYLLPLGARPLLLPDEFRYAEVPREMIASGDWVVPRLAGFLYFEKPILGYWLTLGSEAVLGENRFAVRLPSALTTGLTALLVVLLVRGAAGSRFRATGGLAALVYLSCLLVWAIGTTAVLDAPLTLFLTGALASFFLATAAERASGRERWLLACAGAACGLAFLAKGFLALVLCALVAGAYLAWQRRWLDLVRMPWIPMAVAGIVAAPWSLLVHQRAPGFWPFFFWHEHVERFLKGGAGQHPEPWWFLLAATPLVLLPWTFFAPMSLAGLRRGRLAPELRDLVRFCLVWVASMYLFFSASSGKLVTYVLPAFPALAILLAVGLADGRERSGSWRRCGLVGAVSIGLLAIGGGIVVATSSSPSLQATPTILGLLAALAAVGAVLAWASTRANAGRGRRTLLVAWSFAPLLLALQIQLPARAAESKAPGAFLASHADALGPETLVLSDEDGIRVASWILERDDLFLVGKPGELGYGASQPSDRSRSFDVATAQRFIRENRGRVALFVKRKRYEAWSGLLPPPVSEDSNGPRGFVLATY